MARTDTLGNFLTDVADAIRTKKGTNETILASDFDTEIENLPSGGATGLYRKETVEEMNAIENPNEEDICIVSGTTEENISPDSVFTKATIPASFTISKAALKSVEFRSSDGNEYLRINMKTFFGNDTIDIRTSTASKTITFTKSGTTRTRSDSEESETFIFSSPLLPYDVANWVDDMGNYAMVEVSNFTGIFEYDGTTWNYFDVGSTVSANDIVTGEKAYSNNGVLTGTFGTISTLDEFKTIRDFVDNIDTSQVASFYKAFQKSPAYSVIPLLSIIDTSGATNVSDMFNGYVGTSLDVSHFNTSNVTNMSFMFNNCANITELDLSNFDTRNVTTLSCLFQNDTSLERVNLSSFVTTTVTNISTMFSGCSSLIEIDLSGFDTSNVTDMHQMFSNCSSLSQLDLTNFDTRKVTNMNWLVARCTGLTQLDLSSFYTPLLTDTNRMFMGCTNLAQIDMRNFNFSNVTTYDVMFGADASDGVPNDCEIIVANDTQKTWITSKFSRLTNVKTVAEYEAS